MNRNRCSRCPYLTNSGGGLWVTTNIRDMREPSCMFDKPFNYINVECEKTLSGRLYNRAFGITYSPEDILQLGRIFIREVKEVRK